MFLEKCGKLFFSSMRPIFFFALVFLPLLTATLLLFLEHTELQNLQSRFSNAARKEKIAFARKSRKERFLQRYCHADPYFIDHTIESFPLLQLEKGRLESMLYHPAFPESRLFKDRLAFIDANRLSFVEENIQASAHIKEVDEKQRHPVQMDEHDLKKILSLIEDVPIDTALASKNSPQILIKDFRLKKLQTPLQRDVFEVQMDLLKREFTQ
jgi:hypothetical protein